MFKYYSVLASFVTCTCTDLCTCSDWITKLKEAMNKVQFVGVIFLVVSVMRFVFDISSRIPM